MLEELKSLKKEVQILKDYCEKNNYEFDKNLLKSEEKSLCNSYTDKQNCFNMLEFFNNFNSFKQLVNSKENNLIFMIDESNQIWELVKRDDLTIKNFNEIIENNNINSVVDLNFSELSNSLINVEMHKKANNLQISNEDFLVNKFDGYINELNEFVNK